MIVDTEDLVTVRVICERIHVQQSTISMWKSRYEDFPQPLPIPGTTVWSWVEIRGWYRNRWGKR